MPPPCRLFVSHSSKDNDFTKRVCAALAKGKKPKLALLVDFESLEDGRPWPLQLHEMMTDCAAALVLLTPNSVVESPWVLKETTILTWRQSVDPKFKLFIAQSPSVTDAQLVAARYGPVQHRLIQGIASDDPTHIAARVLTALEADAVRPIETVFDRVVRALAEVLQVMSDELLRALADKLGAERPSWRPGVDERRALLERVAARIVRGDLGQYENLRELVRDLKVSNMTPDGLRKILRFVAPHWVDVGTAALLGGLESERDGKKYCQTAAMNGRHTLRYTSKMYVERAFPLYFERTVFNPVTVAAGNDEDDLTHKICEFCRDQDKKRDIQVYAGMSDAETVELLAAMSPWLFVVLPSSIDPEVFKALKASFPTVHFLLATGHELDPSPHEAVVCLLPVPAETELAQYLQFNDAVQVL